MMIRAKGRITSLLALAGLLAACGNGDAGNSAGNAEIAGVEIETRPVQEGDVPGRDCLAVIWQGQAAPERPFDRENDLVEGGSIACATASTASQFRSALADLRRAAQSGDRAALLREVGLPLVYIDKTGTVREFAAQADLDEAFEEVFNEDVLTILRRLDFEQITVVPNKGAYIDLGALWLMVPETGARPRLVTVNLVAAAEAAAARRARE